MVYRSGLVADMSTVKVTPLWPPLPVAEPEATAWQVTCRDPQWCTCEPGSLDRCEYRFLADAAGSALNPPDGDEGEVVILIRAVEGIAAYVRSLPCTCDPGAAEYDADPCGRCQAIGQRCGRTEPR